MADLSGVGGETAVGNDTLAQQLGRSTGGFDFHLGGHDIINTGTLFFSVFTTVTMFSLMIVMILFIIAMFFISMRMIRFIFVVRLVIVNLFAFLMAGLGRMICV